MTRNIDRIQLTLMFCLLVLLSCSLSMLAQSDSATVVPRLINFSGKVVDAQGKALPGVAGVTFAIYKEEEGGAPLWMETQNVQADKNGRYSVQLGASKSAGLPTELFSTGEARWLGVRINSEAELPRTLLLSVPYALKAHDAETLGGKPLSSFMLLPKAGQNANALGAATEQANEIVCTSATGCKAGFIPLFSSNGGSSKVTDSLVSQSGTSVKVAGSETLTGALSASGNISTSGNVGSRTMTATAPFNTITGTMTGSGSSVAAVTGDATATGAAGFTFGVWGISASDSGRGVFGLSTGASGVGVIGEISSGSNGIGIVGKALPGSTGYGIWGEAASGAVDGVHGLAHTTGSGVAGLNDGGGYGVWGEADGPSIDGVHGVSFDPSGSGVAGVNFNGGIGIYGGTVGGWAGYFGGDVNVTGNLSKAGGSFKIDHPLDPANKYLYHSFVESPDMMNIYNGNATTDAQGLAVIHMPTWFSALNGDFRYQLTVMGQFAQAIVAEKMSGNQFTIKTDKPNVEVSWQVTGVRHDAWANAHRIPVEEQKVGQERGRYIHPELFGAPGSKSITAVRQPSATAKRAAATPPAAAN
jgi:hypothetical protein